MTVAKAAIQFESGGVVEVVDVQIRPPGPGEVRIDMKAAGLCHTDVLALRGTGVAGVSMPRPFVAGHEGAGVVVEVGLGVTDFLVGDHVILSVTAHDGTCEFCRHGHPALCQRTAQLLDPRTARQATVSVAGNPVTTFGNFSTFCEEMVVPAECLVVIDKAVPFDVACLIGCAVSTGVGAVRNVASPGPGEDVLVIGCGGVGLNIVQAARIAEARNIIAVDVSPEKLVLATKLGATHVLDARSGDFVEIARSIAGGLGAHYAFESTGLIGSMQHAIDAIRAGGVAVLLGMTHVDEQLTISNVAGFILQEKRISGSMMGSGFAKRDFPILANEYLAGSLQLDQLITRRRPLTEINEAILDVEAGKGIRTVFML